MEIDIDIVRENIRQLRKQKGWTQAQLAEKLKVSPDTIQKWETLRNKPSVEDVCALADIFGITTDELLKTNFNADFKLIEIIPSVKLTRHKGDSDHEVYVSPMLKGGATLHRFNNQGGVPYSAIYVGLEEKKSVERYREHLMIYDWNRN